MKANTATIDFLVNDNHEFGDKDVDFLIEVDFFSNVGTVPIIANIQTKSIRIEDAENDILGKFMDAWPSSNYENYLTNLLNYFKKMISRTSFMFFKSQNKKKSKIFSLLSNRILNENNSIEKFDSIIPFSKSHLSFFILAFIYNRAAKKIITDPILRDISLITLNGNFVVDFIINKNSSTYIIT